MSGWIRLSLLVGVLIAAIQPACADDKLATIFQGDMLDAQVAYLEQITGPAMHVHTAASGGELRDYRVNGCQVVAYTRNMAVKSYSLVLTPKCNFSLRNFMGDGFSSTAGITVGKFLKSWGGTTSMHAESECIYECGNSRDPTVDFLFEGPHALNFIKIAFTTVIADTPSIDAAEAWSKLMIQNEGEDYVTQARFNCTEKYDSFAIKSFANVSVWQITVGSELPMEAVYKRSCP